MKYEQGQFGELFSLDDKGRIRTCHGKFPTYEERERLMHCANAMECLCPEAVAKIAEWWRGWAKYLAETPRPDSFPPGLGDHLDQLIGADDADNS